MADKSTTLPTRRYVWATDVKQARSKAGNALVREGLVPTKSLLPTLDVKWTGVTRSGSYEYVGNSVDGFREQPSNTQRRYAVDVRV